MGREKQFKLLRQYAAKLPEELIEIKVGKRMSGEELMGLRGLDMIEGQRVDEKTIYRGTGSMVVPVNHYEKMKAELLAGGIPAVEQYVKSVVDRFKSGQITAQNQSLINRLIRDKELREKAVAELKERRRKENRLWNRFVAWIKSIIQKLKK